MRDNWQQLPEKIARLKLAFLFAVPDWERLVLTVRNAGMDARGQGCACSTSCPDPNQKSDMQGLLSARPRSTLSDQMLKGFKLHQLCNLPLRPSARKPGAIFDAPSIV